jgi:hypothetical protein
VKLTLPEQESWFNNVQQHLIICWPWLNQWTEIPVFVFNFSLFFLLLFCLCTCFPELFCVSPSIKVRRLPVTGRVVTGNCKPQHQGKIHYWQSLLE